MKPRCLFVGCQGLWLAWLLSEAVCFGQTPWEAAPALPATPPTGASLQVSPASSSKVVPLPPPPSLSDAIATPAYVPLPPTRASSPAAPAVSTPADNLPLPQWPPPTSFSPQPAPAQVAPGSDAMAGPALPPLPDFNQLPAPSTRASPASIALEGTGLLVGFKPAQTPPLTPAGFKSGELIAVVGEEHILAGDMAVFVEPIIQENRNRIPSPEDEAKLRAQLTRQVLRQYVEIKAMYQEFFRDMVGTAVPKELDDMKKQVLTRASKIFFEKQVPTMLEKYEVATLRELELKLEEKGLSLMILRGQFLEQVLASELERKHIPEKMEVSRDELLEYYRDPANQEEWNVAGRAKWRQLTVRFDKHPDRQEAETLIKNMGNEIYLGGKSFEAVAKQSSEGFTAAEGGVYDWTTQASLKSTQLDAAIFSLPVGRLSKVIEDDLGLHIIEVLEREESHTKDFVNAQIEIREILSERKRELRRRELRDKVMARTSVWTRWPEDIPGSRPLSEAIGAQASRDEGST